MPGEHLRRIVAIEAHRAGALVIAEDLGTVPPGQALRRAGARAGDDLWVSGTIGDGALGLAVLQGRRLRRQRPRRACAWWRAGSHWPTDLWSTDGPSL